MIFDGMSIPNRKCSCSHPSRGRAKLAVSKTDAPPPVKLKNAAQNSPVLRNAALGPRRDNSLPYPMSRTKLKGLTHVMANGKAPGLENPAVLDVKSDRFAERANSYPKKCNAIDMLMSNADCFRNAVLAASGSGFGLGLATIILRLILLGDDVNATFPLGLLRLKDNDARPYGMLGISLGNTSSRASIVLGPPDNAQNWMRLSKSADDTNESTLRAAALMVVENCDSGKNGPMRGADVMTADIGRRLRTVESPAKVKSPAAINIKGPNNKNTPAGRWGVEFSSVQFELARELISCGDGGRRTLFCEIGSGSDHYSFNKEVDLQRRCSLRMV